MAGIWDKVTEVSSPSWTSVSEITTPSWSTVTVLNSITSFGCLWLIFAMKSLSLSI